MIPRQEKKSRKVWTWKKLETRLKPYFEKLQEAITAKDLQATRKAYADLNNTWTRNEAVVRDHSTAYYGKVETAISFLRSAIETEPTNFDSIQSSYNDLKNVLDQFISGEKIEETSSNLTLSDGIKLLKKALSLFQANDTSQASQVMKEFITRVESQSPVIMVKGKESKYQKQLEALISDLSAIDATASYSAVDAMLILLREGVEALLIIMALVTVLKSAKLIKGLKWVYAGALLGILASAAIAVALQFLFPAVTSASNREVIEGAVGIIAVGMMIVIGIWLHRKSSVQKWNQFMESQMKAVTATGSFISMFALSFLAVFREGAETILFYVGILPRIRSFDFFLGIGLALAVLAILAILITKVSHLVKPHKIFFILTWMIYALAFKMLGVSLHALQLTNMLPNHILSNFPTIDWAGIYPSWEVLACQVLFVLIVVIVTVKQHEK